MEGVCFFLHQLVAGVAVHGEGAAVGVVGRVVRTGEAGRHFVDVAG
ncbi:MAG: hypothetical protein LUD46_14240 [Parabacteroides sp.]|nr:hypothetical protein [Parabacteroides sp.]